MGLKVLEAAAETTGNVETPIQSPEPEIILDDKTSQFWVSSKVNSKSKDIRYEIMQSLKVIDQPLTLPACLAYQYFHSSIQEYGQNGISS